MHLDFIYNLLIRFGVFDNSKPMVAQFAWLAKLAQLVQITHLA